MVGPIPPPAHGVAVSTTLVLQNPYLRSHFEVEHVDTSDRRGIANIGTWDWWNVWFGISTVARFSRVVGGPRAVVYLPISQGIPGFVRDSLLIAVAHVRGSTVAIHLRGGEFLDFYLRLSKPWRRWVRWTLGMVDRVAVVSPRHRYLFGSWFSGDEIAVVPNGTPDPFVGGPPARHATRPTILFLSHFRARKGIVEAAEAAVRLLEEGQDIDFVFAGDWEDEALRTRVMRRIGGWEEKIRFVAASDDLAKKELLASADVMLFPPNKREGHPRVVLEAMAAGLPIITTRQAGIDDTVTDDVDGIITDASPPALAAALKELVNDPSRRRQMGAFARQTYSRRFLQEIADERLADWLRTMDR